MRARFSFLLSAFCFAVAWCGCAPVAQDVRPRPAARGWPYYGWATNAPSLAPCTNFVADPVWRQP